MQPYLKAISKGRFGMPPSRMRAAMSQSKFIRPGILLLLFSQWDCELATFQDVATACMRA